MRRALDMLIVEGTPSTADLRRRVVNDAEFASADLASAVADEREARDAQTLAQAV